MKLDFEIAFVQQTKAHDQTFEGVFRTPGAHRYSRDSHALIWSIFDSILPNNLKMLKTMICGVIIVANSFINTYIKFYQNSITIGRVMSKIHNAHIWAYAP